MCKNFECFRICRGYKQICSNTQDAGPSYERCEYILRANMSFGACHNVTTEARQVGSDVWLCALCTVFREQDKQREEAQRWEQG